MASNIKQSVKGLLKSYKKHPKNDHEMSQATKDLIRVSEMISTLINTEEVSYLGKVSFLSFIDMCIDSF